MHVHGAQEECAVFTKGAMFMQDAMFMKGAADHVGISLVGGVVALRAAEDLEEGLIEARIHRRHQIDE